MRPAQGESLGNDGNESFDAIYAVYSADVYRYAFYLTGRPDAAQDLFQETWFRIVKNIGRLKSVLNKKSWILTVESNIFRDVLRKRKRRKTISTFHSVDCAAEANHDLRIDIQMDFAKALTKLPARQKQVFLLKEVEGYKLKEIAKILHIPTGTVKSLLFRAVKKLQKQMAE